MVLSWDKPLFTLQIECVRGNKKRERDGWQEGRLSLRNQCTEITQFTPFTIYTYKNETKERKWVREKLNESKPGCDYTFQAFHQALVMCLFIILLCKVKSSSYSSCSNADKNVPINYNSSNSVVKVLEIAGCSWQQSSSKLL